MSLVCALPMVYNHFWKNTFLTRFSPIFGPKALFKAFWDFPCAKTRHHGLKMGEKYLFGHPKWSRNNFGKNDPPPPGDPGGPTVGPHRARPRLRSGSTK